MRFLRLPFVGLVSLVGCGGSVASVATKGGAPDASGVPGLDAAAADTNEDAGADANESGGADTNLPCAAQPWIIFLVSSQGPGSALAAMRADGSERHLLALPGDAGSAFFGETPSVTPDGAALLYASNNSIRRFDFASQTDRVLLVGAGAQYPAASPDGTLIAFTTQLALHVANADGSGDRTLLAQPDDGCCSWWYIHPAFSVDSRSIDFVEPFAVANDAYELDSIGVSGGGLRTLGTDSPVGLSSWIQLAFSPDASRFAAALVCGDQVTLRVYDSAILTRSTAQSFCDVGQLLTAAGVAEGNNVSWGPHDQIAFGLGTSLAPLGDDIGVVSANGGPVTNLTRDMGNTKAFYPVWADACVQLPLGAAF
jgi:hypothetical protein